MSIALSNRVHELAALVLQQAAELAELKKRVADLEQKDQPKRVGRPPKEPSQ